MTASPLLDWEPVRFRLQALKSSKARTFGARAHKFELAPVLRESEVAEAEAQWGIRFPADYRAFLMQAGAGGAGPYYGLFPLAKVEGKWRWEGDGGDMSSAPEKPWRHSKRWNLEGHALWDSEPDEEDERFDSESFDDAYELWNEKFYEIYWDAKWTEGGICLCHEGCALRDWLVVSGPQAGQIWWDGSADRAGLMPCENSDASSMNFTDWYLDWLNKCERSAADTDLRK
jgi:hypothetical protein